MNDPYCGGTHLNDVTLLYPVFRMAARLLRGGAEHWSDVGGAVPGSLSGSATDIYQEGIQHSPDQARRRRPHEPGRHGRVFASMRVREERIGDFRSGLAACRVRRGAASEIVPRYGVDKLLAAVRQDRSRRSAHARADQPACLTALMSSRTISRPCEDGSSRCACRSRSGSEDDELTADFTEPRRKSLFRELDACGHDRRRDHHFEGRLGSAAPMNYGSFRPVTVIAPEGTIVNVRTRRPPARMASCANGLWRR